MQIYSSSLWQYILVQVEEPARSKRGVKDRDGSQVNITNCQTQEKKTFLISNQILKDEGKVKPHINMEKLERFLSKKVNMATDA